jgi:predicted short-subunit dehydrogenase-like oxidoreductase (DUF2520 family)
MINIVILGAGNVATHLFNAFHNSEGVSVVQVYNRSNNKLNYFEGKTITTTSISKIIDADVYLIAVADDSINSLSKKLQFNKKIVAHTSGSIGIDQISNHNHAAVFYPLQTFTIGKELNFKNIPLCIEASCKDDLLVLENLAKIITDNIYFINSEQRRSLHLAAVFVNNFVNHLYQKGEEICNEHKVSFEILKPLILETAKKVTELSPIKSQTGPAKRNDQKVLNQHITIIKNKNQLDIYNILTKSIQETYVNKL